MWSNFIYRKVYYWWLSETSPGRDMGRNEILIGGPTASLDIGLFDKTGLISSLYLTSGLIIAEIGCCIMQLAKQHLISALD